MTELVEAYFYIPPLQPHSPLIKDKKCVQRGINEKFIDSMIERSFPILLYQSIEHPSFTHALLCVPLKHLKNTFL